MHVSPTPGPAPAGRLSTFKSDFLASLVVFMVALPLCVAIARACGLPAELGLITGIVGGLIVAPLSGSPLQVSGPAAGLIVLVIEFLEARKQLHASGESPYDHIVALGVVVFLAGLLQLVMAAFRLGLWFRAVSPAVVLGMLGGIGVVIVAKQVHEMIDDRPAASVTENLLTIPAAAYKAVTDADPNPPYHTAAVTAGLVTLFVLLTWKAVAPGRLKVLPAALVAVVAGTLVAEGFGLPARRITVEANLFDRVTWLTPGALGGLIVDRGVWTMAVAIAVIASAETLLCATAVDQMHRGPRTNYNRELMAQGVGNAVCGVLGGLPMTGVIVRSTANVQAGAQTRLSATLHGLWLLLFVALLTAVLERIPAACLAAVLVYTGLKLVNWRAARALWRDSRGEFLIFLVTLLGVVFADLLSGVLLGVVLSAAKLVYTVSHLSIRAVPDPAKKETQLYLEGAATFVSLPKLALALEQVPPGWSVHVYLDGLLFIDHSCLHLLAEWEKQHEATGGRLSLDQDGLRARFDRARVPAANGSGAPPFTATADPALAHPKPHAIDAES
jgi:MFS superfamily sulfate permease-like transporter